MRVSEGLTRLDLEPRESGANLGIGSEYLARIAA